MTISTPRPPGETRRQDDPFSSVSRDVDYRLFTTAFDETVGAEELCDEEELDRLRAFLDKQLSSLQGVVGRLANRLQRRLMAQQNRAWDFDLEEGVLDPARLPRLVIDPMQPLSFKQERDTNFRDNGRDPGARQLRLHARPSDHRRRHLRRHPGPHAGALRRLRRDPRLHDARLGKGGQGPALRSGWRRAARQALADQRSAPQSII